MFEYNVDVLRIIDGDTIDVDIDLGFDVWLRNERIRLNGVDAPESRTSDKVERLFGVLAKHRVKQYLENDGKGGKVTLISKSFKQEKYGRIMADLRVEGQIRTLCATLITEGYAVPYRGQSKESIAKDHLANRERLIFEGKITREEVTRLSASQAT